MVAEPRHLKTAYAVIYLLTALIGTVTLARPPQTIEGPLGPVASTAWACAFIVGGLAGLLAVFPGWWWAERALAIAPALIGLGIYGTVVVWQHVQSVLDGGGGSRLTQIGVILLASAPFLLRGLLIREYLYEPRR